MYKETNTVVLKLETGYKCIDRRDTDIEVYRKMRYTETSVKGEECSCDQYDLIPGGIPGIEQN